MAGRKPNGFVHDREARIQRETEMYIKGMSLKAIADEVKLSIATISNDLAKVRERWIAESIVNYDEAVAREIAKIDNLEMTSWKAWEKSLEDSSEEVKKKELAREAPQKGDKKAKPSKPRLVPVKIVEEVRRKGQTGDPRFLERIAWCIETRSKLLGLIKKDTVQNNTFVQIDWAALTSRPEETSADRIQEELNKALLPPPTNGEANGQGH